MLKSDLLGAWRLWFYEITANFGVHQTERGEQDGGDKH